MSKNPVTIEQAIHKPTEPALVISALPKFCGARNSVTTVITLDIFKKASPDKNHNQDTTTDAELTGET